MSAVSLPVNRPVGRALVVAAPGARLETTRILAQLGYESVESDDPYTAFVELCRNRLAYNAVILGLSSLYREELAIIAAVKRRFPHLEIWLTQTDGRQAALADGVRLGADGLLAEDGLHRVAAEPVESTDASPSEREKSVESMSDDFGGDDAGLGEPVLSADELRALLQEQPVNPPGSSHL